MPIINWHTQHIQIFGKNMIMSLLLLSEMNLFWTTHLFKLELQAWGRKNISIAYAPESLFQHATPILSISLVFHILTQTRSFCFSLHLHVSVYTNCINLSHWLSSFSLPLLFPSLACFLSLDQFNPIQVRFTDMERTDTARCFYCTTLVLKR